MEKTNVRYLTPDQLEGPGDFASVDVSFISLNLVLPPLLALLSKEAELVLLVKPQFEAGRDKVGKKGVVRDRAVHREVLEKVCGKARELGCGIRGMSYSPIKGPEGNIEYLLYLSKEGGAEEAAAESLSQIIDSLVEESHRELDA